MPFDALQVYGYLCMVMSSAVQAYKPYQYPYTPAHQFIVRSHCLGFENLVGQASVECRRPSAHRGFFPSMLPSFET